MTCLQNRMMPDHNISEYATSLRDFMRRSLAASIGSRTPSGDDAGFNQLALALFALQFAGNEPYRRFCQGRGVSPASVSDWTAIPAIPASAFKEFELTCLAPSEWSVVFYSSGTTGHVPSRHFHDAESLRVYEASVVAWFKACFLADFEEPIEDGDQGSTEILDMIFLTPPPAEAPHSSLVHMFETVRREFGGPDSFFAGGADSSGSWHLDSQRVEFALRESEQARRPVAILGTAFNFVHLLDHLVDSRRHHQLPAGTRILETGGYKGRSRALPQFELHALMTRVLGIPPDHILCEYGMSELSSQAYDSIVEAVSGSRFQVPGSKRVFHFPPWARAQIISPETGRPVSEGETGLIRVLDLANVKSVMAIQTEDLGVRRGAGFALAGRAPAAENRGCSLMSA